MSRPRTRSSATATAAGPSHPTPILVGLACSAGHHFSKQACNRLQLLQGLGVQGDAHQGLTVQHRSRVARDPSQPNLRQVHLLHAELLDELQAGGFRVGPGALGENLTTRGLNLLALPTGTRLELGDGHGAAPALIELTGLRNPCAQLDQYQAGLMAAVLDRAADGSLVRKAGVMAVVLRSGELRLGDTVRVHWPAGPHLALAPV